MTSKNAYNPRMLTNVYADDIASTIASNNVVKMTEGARKELANIAEWMRVNSLSPNPQ